MNEFIRHLAGIDPVWIYAVIFAASFIENIFPPSPSDAVVVFGGALAAMDRGNLVAALLAGAAGSTVGFMTMYVVGRWFGRRILDAGKIRFINLDALRRLEGWFTRYGYRLIIANRFLAGTRAVVSFFAGIARLDLGLTTLLSFVSSLLWYGILVTAGYSLGDHWEEAGSYLKSYGEIMTLIVTAGLVIFLVVKLRKRAGRPGGSGGDGGAGGG